MNKPKIDIHYRKIAGIPNNDRVMSVVVDGKECGRFNIGVIKKLLLTDICTSLGIAVDYSDGKMQYANQCKRFSEKYGMGPKHFKKILIASVYTQVIRPREDVVKFYCMRKDGISFHALRKFLQNEELFTTAYNDAKRGVAANVVPLVWEWRKDTQKLKHRLGKSVWKTLCKNSKYRNQIISQCANSLARIETLTRIESFLKTPTSVLKELQCDYRCSIEMLSNMRGYVASYSRLSGFDKMRFRDTWEMSKRLGVYFDYTIVKNSPKDKDSIADVGRRISLLHDEYVLKLNEQKQKESMTPFDFNENITNEIELLGVKIKRLNSPFEMQEEGKMMHHCVSSYSHAVKSGSYVVYHLQHEREHATIGISITQRGIVGLSLEHDNLSGKSILGVKYRKDQMYGVCNRPVTDENIIKASEMLLNILNQKQKDRIAA